MSTAAAAVSHSGMDEDLHGEHHVPHPADQLTPSADVTPFVLTDIGEGILEVELLQWFVQPGDRVRQFDKVCEVQSDKATVEITSRYDGVVAKLHWNTGDMVQTGATLMDIAPDPTTDSPTILGGVNGSATTASTPGGGSSLAEGAVLASGSTGVARLSVPPAAPAATAAAASPADAPPAGGDLADWEEEVAAPLSPARDAGERKVLATPAVRRVCRELGVDPSTAGLIGTGPDGRLLKGDVLQFVKARDRLPGLAGGGGGGGAAAVGPAAAPARSSPPPAVPATGWGPASSEPFQAAVIENAPPDVAAGEEPRVERGRAGTQEKVSLAWEVGEEDREVPIRGVQRAMMEAMQRSLEIPHMTFCDEVEMDRLSELRGALKEAAEARGVKLSFLPLVIKAASLALKQHPMLNASLSTCKTHMVYHRNHNIGVAMDTARGLLVPCIKGAQERSVLDIAEELNALQRLGAEGKLGEAELSHTTFTLSNIGSIGGTYASPVIMAPQVCIGALGRMQREPRLDDRGEVVARSLLAVSWSADHRVVDGGTLARFSNLFRRYVENPAVMLGDAR